MKKKQPSLYSYKLMCDLIIVVASDIDEAYNKMCKLVKEKGFHSVIIYKEKIQVLDKDTAWISDLNKELDYVPLYLK